MVAFSAAAVVHNAGEPEKTKVTTTAKSENGGKLRNSSVKRVPSHLGTTRRVPGHWGSSEVEGGALAAVKLAGAEDENVETTAWATLARPRHRVSFHIAQRCSPSNELK